MSKITRYRIPRAEYNRFDSKDQYHLLENVQAMLPFLDKYEDLYREEILFYKGEEALATRKKHIDLFRLFARGNNRYKFIAKISDLSEQQVRRAVKRTLFELEGLEMKLERKNEPKIKKGVAHVVNWFHRSPR